MNRNKLHPILRNIYSGICLLFLLYIPNSCTESINEIPNSTNQLLYFESDLETIKQKEENTVFSTSNSKYTLAGAINKSTNQAKSGTNSLLLDATHLYGLNCQIENPNNSKFGVVSVWMHASNPKAYLHVSLSGEGGQQTQNSFPLETSNKNGWILHRVSFALSPAIKTIRFHVFSGNEVTYIDDLTVEILSTLPKNNLPKELHLFIPDSSKQLLDGYITNALTKDKIGDESKKYVSGSYINESDSTAIKIRLKGDLKDHLGSGKESYRIKIGGNYAYDGLKSFSIQHPQTRNFMNEWIIHQLAEQEDILTTTYDFINVKINTDFKGVYALEEHFDKQLLESRNRREGPILKYDEASYWAWINAFDGTDTLRQLPYFEQSQISVFKKKRTGKNPQLRKQFYDGSKLLASLKSGHANIEDLFDIDQLAKFYVLTEISGGWHALRWHNRRFYFNPITQKLEHIAYDILPFNNKRNFKNNLANKLSALKEIQSIAFDNSLLYSSKFKKRYLHHLQRMTKKTYWDSLFTKLDTSINTYYTAINGEMSYYSFDQNIFYENAAYLRKEIPILNALWEKNIKEKKAFNWIAEKSYQKRTDELFVKEISVNAYRTKRDSSYEIYLENFHVNPITITGYQINASKQETILLDTPITLKGYNKHPEYATIQSQYQPKKIYFTVSNDSSLTITKKITPWPKPKGISTRMELETKFAAIKHLFDIKNDQIIFEGNVEIDQLIALPNYYSVVIAPGTTITFKNGGGLIVSNSITASGTREQPIHITCTDASANGLTILQGDSAIFEHVNISGMSNLNYKNWELTGALTIYETTTRIKHCTISDSKAEDALNLIRSTFTIDDLNLDKTWSDGFDADFCTGTLQNATFTNTGNDCIDFSGSTITIKNTNISNAGDKGISAGEASNITIEDITITNTEIGIAAKDASVVTGHKINLNDTKIGCVAFQKKPEYSGAFITLNEIKIATTKQQFIIQKGSAITLNGIKELGKTDITIEKAYLLFQ